MKRYVLTILLSVFVTIVYAQSAQELLQAGSDAENSGDYSAAIELYFKAKAAFENDGKIGDAEYAQTMHNIGRAYSQSNELEAARKYDLMALDLREKLFGKVSEPYISTLNNYALTYGIADDYSTAVDIMRQVVDLMEQLPSEHSQATMFWFNMGRYCYLADDYQDAAKYCELSLKGLEKFSAMYELCLKILGFAYTELNQSDNLSRIMALQAEHNEHELSKPCDEPDCMLERAEYYYSANRYADAKEIYNKLLGMSLDDKTKRKLYASYAQYLYGSEKNAALASAYYEKAADLSKKLNDDREEWISMLYQSVLLGYLAGEYQKTIDKYQALIDYYSLLSTANAMENVIKYKNGIANAYGAMKDYEAALPIRKEISDYYLKYTDDKEQQAKALANLATAEKFTSRYDDAIVHYQAALDIYKEIGDVESFRNTTTSLNMCYLYAGKEMDAEYDEDAFNKRQNEKLDKIIADEIANLEITRQYLGQLVYASSLATIAGCYYMKGDYRNAVEYYKEFLPALRDAVRYEFRLRNNAGRTLIWETEKDNLAEVIDLLVNMPMEYSELYPEVCALAYDIALLSKGILLNSAIEFEQVLSKSKPELLALYEKTKSNDEKIESLRAKASTQTDLDEILALTRENENLQLQLMRECAEYADFTDYIAYDWHDVQHALTADDIAVEFFAAENGFLPEDQFIAAAILTKDMDLPMVTPICTMKDLEIIEDSEEIFNNPDLDKLIWGVIDGLLAGKKRVYFSADGALNRISIEYLNYDGKPFNEQFDVYRLSSTKELCKRRQSPELANAILIGDINYNEAGKLSKGASRAIKKMRGVDFDDLEETKREISEIESILKGAKVGNVVVLDGVNASEVAFAELSGANVNMIHLATHGAYLGDDKQSDAQAMQNSILAFAGVNIDNDEDNDGIVTAADVAKMDLRQCDLVVLSACETALGKLNDDGVFGLQRGFKNAGVGSLLMSTKPVYDESAAELMIAFYDNLFKGKSKREALKLAQQSLKDKGYTDPDHWTPFILLDALD